MQLIDCNIALLIEVYLDQLFYLLIIFCVHNQYLPILYIFSMSFFAAALPAIWIFYNLGTFTVYYSSYSISVTVNRVKQSQYDPPPPPPPPGVTLLLTSSPSAASHWLLSLILRRCLQCEPSPPEAKVAAMKAPEAMNEPRQKQSKRPAVMVSLCIIALALLCS